MGLVLPHRRLASPLPAGPSEWYSTPGGPSGGCLLALGTFCRPDQIFPLSSTLVSSYLSQYNQSASSYQAAKIM